MALRRDAKIELLRSVPLFARCSREQLRRIASIADEVTLREGKTLTREGDRGREFFVLLDGTVAVRRGGRKLAERGSGDFIGEMALLTDLPRRATVTATSSVDALVVSARDFRRLLREVPDIQLKVLQTLAERLAGDTL